MKLRRVLLAAMTTSMAVGALAGCTAGAENTQSTAQITADTNAAVGISDSVDGFRGNGNRSVPAQLRVPAGNRLIASMPAHGVQTYQCTNKSWTLLEPDAILDYRGTQVLHSRGPVWTSVGDGSSVSGTAIASSPVAGAVPELLLKSSGNRGQGLLATVAFVQRLDTRGGAAPSGACAEGAVTSVPYTANYSFWAPSR